MTGSPLRFLLTALEGVAHLGGGVVLSDRVKPVE